MMQVAFRMAFSDWLKKLAVVSDLFNLGFKSGPNSPCPMLIVATARYFVASFNRFEFLSEYRCARRCAKRISFGVGEYVSTAKFRLSTLSDKVQPHSDSNKKKMLHDFVIREINASPVLNPSYQIRCNGRSSRQSGQRAQAAAYRRK